MEIALLKDRDWKQIEDEVCRVKQFTPLAQMENGEVFAIRSVAYATVSFECLKLDQEATGVICHKLDFIHLWTAFKVRGIKPSEEVVIIWSKRHLRWFAKVISWFMPRICVWICKKGAYELMTDPDSRPELQGWERWLAEKPIETLKPQVWT